MSFYDEARVDGLHKREETSTEMTEHFRERPDGLFYRHVVFGKRVKKFGPAEEAGAVSRPIDRITERYRRNPALPANEDVSERVFVINEDRILLTYHTEGGKISASTREYNKPPHSDEKGGTIIMQQDTHSTFQVCSFSSNSSFTFDCLPPLSLFFSSPPLFVSFSPPSFSSF